MRRRRLWAFKPSKAAAVTNKPEPGSRTAVNKTTPPPPPLPIVYEMNNFCPPKVPTQSPSARPLNWPESKPPRSMCKFEVLSRVALPMMEGPPPESPGRMNVLPPSCHHDLLGRLRQPLFQRHRSAAQVVVDTQEDSQFRLLRNVRSHLAQSPRSVTRRA